MTEGGKRHAYTLWKDNLFFSHRYCICLGYIACCYVASLAISFYRIRAPDFDWVGAYGEEEVSFYANRRCKSEQILECVIEKNVQDKVAQK